MKHIKFLLALIMFYTSTTSAGPPDSVLSVIQARSHDSLKGLIVAVTERGEVAADTAWLLSAQVMQDAGYTPLLLVLKTEELEGTLSIFKLTASSLPALIYYNRDGNEISRVIGVMPSPEIKHVKSKSNNDDL